MIMNEWNVAYAESDKVGSLAAQNICLKNQHIKINVVVTQAILDFCNMELFQGGKCREKCTHVAFRIDIACRPRPNQLCFNI